MSGMAGKLREEVRELLPPTLYFLVTLHLIALVRALMLEGTSIAPSTSASVTLGALILAKAVVLADLLPAINRFPDRPLAWNVAWKSLVYLLAATVLHYLERLVEHWRDAGGFLAANERMLQEMIWPHFWALEIFIALVIVSYCIGSELGRALGRDRARQLFFGGPATRDQPAVAP